jgi:hypothetical protein
VSALYPLHIAMNIGVNELDTVQYLTNMFFRGVIEGRVEIAITIMGPTLMFTNAQDVTFVQLDNSILNEYTEAVAHVVQQINRASHNYFTNTLVGGITTSNGGFATQPNTGFGISGIGLSNGTLANWSNPHRNTP